VSSLWSKLCAAAGDELPPPIHESCGHIQEFQGTVLLPGITVSTSPKRDYFPQAGGGTAALQGARHGSCSGTQHAVKHEPLYCNFDVGYKTSQVLDNPARSYAVPKTADQIIALEPVVRHFGILPPTLFMERWAATETHERSSCYSMRWRQWSFFMSLRKMTASLLRIYWSRENTTALEDASVRALARQLSSLRYRLTCSGTC